MYIIKLCNFEKKYLLEELIKVFLKADEYEIVPDEFPEERCDIIINHANSTDRNTIKREIYDKLFHITNKIPPWGILTGIRPVKLCGEIFNKTSKSKKGTIDILVKEYYLQEQKAKEVLDIYLYQQEAVGSPKINSASIYISIPFCPSKCSYCTFPSNTVTQEEIDKYLNALCVEIDYVSAKIKEKNIQVESIYVGGGTPSILNTKQLNILLEKIKRKLNYSSIKEITVEAGRPDTITKEKLQLLKKFNIPRISINPQTFNDSTLDVIGRKHSSEDIITAYSLAREVGIESINMDIIAGLPNESVEDFSNTLHKLLELRPDNITLHGLAMKRKSILTDKDKSLHHKSERIVSEMMELSQGLINSNGYKPYYLYRQKNMAANSENIGYTLTGKESYYNIRIMEEHQIIIAIGAAAVSKSYYPEEDRLERIPNVSNYAEYIARVDEMIQRKEINLFGGTKNNGN